MNRAYIRSVQGEALIVIHDITEQGTASIK